MPLSSLTLPRRKEEKEMKASFKARYEPNKAAAAATVTADAGDFKLRASMTEATVIKGPSLNGLSLALEKPGFFIIDYNVPKKVSTPVSINPMFVLSVLKFYKVFYSFQGKF